MYLQYSDQLLKQRVWIVSLEEEEEGRRFWTNKLVQILGNAFLGEFWKFAAVGGKGGDWAQDPWVSFFPKIYT